MKPCPHCGGTDIRCEHEYPPIPVRHFDWSVYCAGCIDQDWVVQAYGETPKSAHEAWDEQAEEWDG